MVGQFITSIPWGAASDRFGRKPVIIIGQLASAYATLGLGLTREPSPAPLALRAIVWWLPRPIHRLPSSSKAPTRVRFS